MTKLTAIITTFLAAFVILAAINFSSEGVITLEDYSQAVALCGEEELGNYYEDDNMVMMQDRFATIIINKGHRGDPQVKQLRNKADKLCKQYYR